MHSVIILGVVVLDVMAPAEGVNHKSTPIVFNVSQSSLSTNFLFLKKVSFFYKFLSRVSFTREISPSIFAVYNLALASENALVCVNGEDEASLQTAKTHCKNALPSQACKRAFSFTLQE